MDIQHATAWGIFLAFVLAMLGFDLLVLHRKPREVELREAFVGAVLPVILALLFVGIIYAAYEHHWLDLGVASQTSEQFKHLYPQSGYDAAVQFVTGYIVELSLSADNIFLFVILMNVFKVPRHLQHRVLFWGVLGAIVMRGIMIVVGATLIARFQWIIYLFGAFLLYTAWRMLFASHETQNFADGFGSRLARKFFPVHPEFVGNKFFVSIGGPPPRRMATTLFVVLVCIEFTDLVFALDSIPAIFGITRDAFIVFTSNVFAILGLRSMYFLLAGVIDKFQYLKTGLAVVLGFVGAKMLLPGIGAFYGRYVTGTPQHWDIDEFLSLAIIVGTLTVSILASIVRPPKHQAAPHQV
ncbi:MAG TPA: TerC family protein [Phycisphaerae bacterium]|nr:TerC family protein [Phycisphaerae bacterium]